MIGQKYEKLTVVQRLKGSVYRCLCDCGNERLINVGHFNSGYAKSCGCHVERHNKYKSREHISWGNMIARCHNKNNKRFKDYGAKGIVVCERWRNSFKDFYDDMGDCPEGFQIDRENNLGIYEPGNCRWVSPKDNAANRSTSKVYVINGEEYKSTIDAAIKHGVNTSTIFAWCEGRKVRDYLAKKKEYVERIYPPKDGCTTRYVYG